MILPIDEELARVFVAAYDRLRSAPEGERLPGALAAVRERLEFEAEAKRKPARRLRAVPKQAVISNYRLAHPAMPIIARIASEFGMEPRHLTGPSRIASVSLARAYAMWAIRDSFGRAMSFPTIGIALGGRDHSTVIAAVRKVASLVAADEVLAARLRALAVGPAAKTLEAA